MTLYVHKFQFRASPLGIAAFREDRSISCHSKVLTNGKTDVPRDVVLQNYLLIFLNFLSIDDFAKPGCLLSLQPSQDTPTRIEIILPVVKRDTSPPVKALSQGKRAPDHPVEAA